MQEKRSELFTPMEVEALKLLLAGELPILQQLRAQIEHIVGVKRTFTPIGFYLGFELTEQAPIIRGEPSFVISDVNGPAEGTPHGIGFVLFIKSGRVHALEGVTNAGEEWPTEIGKFSLGYDRGERDWTALEEMIQRKVKGLEP